MREYGKVSPKFWTGKTGKALRKHPEAQLVALYLMTCPLSEMTGVFQCPIMYVAHETGLGEEGALKGLARLYELDFCTFDEDTDTFFVHEMAKWQIGDSLKINDKQVIGVKKAYANMPEGRIKQGFYERYRDAFHLGNKEESNSPSEAPSEPLGSQEQEQEQEQNNSSSAKADVSGNEVPRPPACPHQQLIELYHEVLPMGTRVNVWSDANAKHLQTRWREKAARQDLDWWRRFFEYVAKSEFLTGRTSARDRDPFVVSLGWLVKAENFAKVVNGTYHREAA